MEYFSYYLTGAETASMKAQWAALRTRLAGQKIINPNKAFTNLLASRLDDVRDRLITVTGLDCHFVSLSSKM